MLQRLNFHENMISNVLNNKNKTAHGYIWRDKKVELDVVELESITKHSKSIIVIQVMDDGREIKYDSMVEASKKTGLSVGIIERKIKKYKDGCSGFRYSDISQKKSNLSAEDIISINNKYSQGVSVKNLEKEYGKSVKQLRRVLTKTI